jgi:hypothetical protein
MKRTIGSLAAAAIAAGALGQANFTIMRPFDGAHVREQVHVLFPMGSIPSGGYVGIFLNGQLIDALVPTPHGKNLEYVLDTKARGIPDTPAGKPDRLEAKLYVDYNDQPRITKTSSVDLYVGNHANIQVPPQGIALRYNFVPGTSMVYDLQQRVATGSITEADRNKGGKEAELPLDTENMRLMYSVDNRYGNGDGLLRLQALPEKGKSYAVITAIQATTLAPETRPFFDWEMASVYMKLTTTGREEFGSVPAFFPMDGAAGTANASDLYAVYPLPTLPSKLVAPGGDPWQAPILVGNVDPSDMLNATSLVKTFPGRGEFVDVEWEHDHPCAKIRNTIGESEMSDEDKKMLSKNADVAGEKIKLEETIWFALDTHKILKIVRDETIDTKTQSAVANTGGPPTGAGGYPGMGGPGGRYPGMGGPGGGYPGMPPGYPGGPGGPGGRGRGRGGDWAIPFNQVNPLMQGPPRGRIMGAGAGPTGPMGPGSGRQGAPAQTAATQTEYQQLRIEQIFTLEE